MNRIWIAIFVSVCMPVMGQTVSAPARPATAARDSVDTSTDFLSDEGWRQLPREARRARSRASMLARYEPSGTPSADKLDTYIDRFRQFNIYDARLAWFKVRAERVAGTSGTVKLLGEVSLPNYSKGLQSTLESLTFTVAENNITVLPTPELGEKLYGLATTSAATIRKEPRDQSEQVNSVGMGGMVRLLRTGRADDLTTGSAGWRGGGMRSRRSESGEGANAEPASPGPDQWFLAQSTEGYMGFMRADQLRRTDSYRLPDVMLTVPTTVTLSGAQVVLPVGALLYASGDGYATGPDERPVDGDLKVAPVGRPAFTAEQVLELTKPLLGVRYVWGGVTSDGIDCSGFSQFLWKTKGINLPRDAEEQATVGQIVAWGKDVETAAQPGDLIYFMNESGRVNHVAISLGGKNIIHSSGRDVHVSNLDERKEDDEVLLTRILYARRVQGQ